MRLTHITNYIVLVGVLLSTMAFPISSHAATKVEELNKKIQDQKAFIEQLNKEIAEKQADLLKVGSEKQSLQTAIKTLEASRKKVEADVEITTTELTIQKIGHEIEDKSTKLSQSHKTLSASIRIINDAESYSLLEQVLSNKNLASVWDGIETLIRFNGAIKAHADELRGIKKELELTQEEKEAQKKELENFKKQLSGQQQTIESNKKEKDVLLTQTKNKESEYQRIIAEKKALKEAFEKELFSYEAELKLAIDPSSFPKNGTILSWPVAKPRITQYFGRTVDAQRLYVSGTHNGIDIGIPDGTPIKAALGGTVKGIGNTDGGGCYSYGKWILIEHPNGLSTMYAHLSSYAVSAGDTVETGQTIGASGHTGYATGPHLHFTVYASQGVRIMKYENSNYCKNATIPIADQKAYLDPMHYLPAL
jgi:murein DD-endopeptidase MepM/ murein hydrolase activator NlpD